MMRRLSQLTLRLYPLAFRRRYEPEMRALLDETPPRAATVLDLLLGALAAHLRPPRAAADLVGGADRIRASASAQLACWVVFAAAGFGFYKTTEDASFTIAAHAHPLLGVTHAAVQVLAVVASAAVLAGALPLIAAALARARRQPSLRPLVAVPVLAVALFAGLTGALVVLAHSPHAQRPTAVGGVAFIAWGVAGLACGGACVWAARTVLFALPLSRRRLLMAFSYGTLVSAAMAAITLATLLYTAALAADAPSLAATSNGPLQAISTAGSLAVQLLVMACAAALAAITTSRGRGVVGQLDPTRPQ